MFEEVFHFAWRAQRLLSDTATTRYVQPGCGEGTVCGCATASLGRSRVEARALARTHLVHNEHVVQHDASRERGDRLGTHSQA